MPDETTPTVADESDLMTPAEARRVLAEMGLRVGPTTLGRWAREGRIEAVTLPSGRRRYRRSTVAAILAGENTPAR